MSSNKTFPIVFKASVHFICFLSQVSDIPLDYDIANNYSCLDLYILLFLWLEFLWNPLPPEIICDPPPRFMNQLYLFRSGIDKPNYFEEHVHMSERI